MSLIKNVRGELQTEVLDFVLENCCNCGIPFLIPKYHQKRLINSRESFYCPSGHSMSYTGKTEAQKLKEELERVKLQKQQEETRLTNLFLDEVNQKNKLTKQLKRLHKGVCPCCNRSFVNLANHIKTKHPEIIKNDK